MKITPTVGRVVWFHPAANQATSGFTPPNEGQPLAAIIAGVVDAEAGVVHLAVFDAVGTPSSQPYVPLIQEDQNVPEGVRYATWMPYQIDQAKKAEDREHDAKQLAVAADRAADNRGLRAHALEMALRTPGVDGHHDVLKATEAYQAHIDGAKTAPAPTAREQTLEDLLRSACAIADRKGEGTAWERFAASIHAVGLNGVTARTYRILPSDEQ
jgi:hypothetical protein